MINISIVLNVRCGKQRYENRDRHVHIMRAACRFVVTNTLNKHLRKHNEDTDTGHRYTKRIGSIELTLYINDSYILGVANILGDDDRSRRRR